MNYKFIALLSFSFCFILKLSAELNYRISHLDLDKTCSYAYCINNNGNVCGVFDTSDSNRRYRSSFYWSQETGVVELPSGENFKPHSMNDSGKIVGLKDVITKLSSNVYDNTQEGYLISLDADCENWKNFRPRSINNHNNSIGDNAIKSGNATNYSHNAYIKYQDKDSQPLNLYDVYYLNLYDRYKSKKMRCRRVEYQVNSMNNNDDIVGTATASGFSIFGIPDGLINHAFLLRNKKMIEIGENYSAVDINDRSQVLLVKTGQKFSTTLIWENNTFITLWNGGYPKAINNMGAVVGFAGDGAAVIWENGKTSFLYNLLENPEGWTQLNIAEDINDRGEIVGYGIYNGHQTAFLLTPVAPL